MAGISWPLLLVSAMLGAMLSPYMVLLANLINRPIEKGINQYYIRDARRMLKACPNLKIIGITARKVLRRADISSATSATMEPFRGND